MEVPSWAARGLFFGSGAELYDQTRPSYPTDSIRWVLGHEPMIVVDLGAGTGILSRQLVALGYQTIAVEPDDVMRARLAANSLTVTVLTGTAESIPLPDASADAVHLARACGEADDLGKAVRGPLGQIRSVSAIRRGGAP
jgi:ubiquinone/menaquinone biosynthesis C-methylase UbiE